MKLRRTFLLWPLLLAALAIAGCFGRGDEMHVCTLEFRYGLVVTLKDGAGTPICDASVVAVDGAFHETLQMIGCQYEGAGERAGNYTVTISKSGFATQTLDVGVTSDQCHVHTEQRNLTLTP